MTNQSLEEYIEATHIFETHADKEKKSNSVKSLESIATNWVLKKSNATVDLSSDGLPCCILVQGSTVLGVSFQGSDLDAVLLVPNFITTNDFFGSFYQDLDSCYNVTDLVGIQDTFVPLIKMKFDGVEIDLVLSRLSTNFVPKKIDFKSICSDIYINLDPISIRGLSGVHMSREFASLVPDKILFKNTLKAIRAWVRARRLNDYVYGFPSSTSWAIMTAYVCIRQDANHMNYSGNCSSQNDVVNLLRMFFTTFSKWCWPDPVIISPITNHDNIHSLYSWDPQRNARDSCEVMPIITPVFPHKNSAFTARLYTREIFTQECRRGSDIMEDIFNGRQQWRDLYKPYEITEHYNHFIQLTLFSKDKNEFNRIGGLVDSRLRDFAQFLEEDELVKGARIIDNQMEKKNTGCNGNDLSHVTRCWLVALDIHKREIVPGAPRPKINIDITEKIQEFYKILGERAIGMDFERKLIVSYRKKKELLNELSRHV